MKLRQSLILSSLIPALCACVPVATPLSATRRRRCGALAHLSSANFLLNVWMCRRVANRTCVAYLSRRCALRASVFSAFALAPSALAPCLLKVMRAAVMVPFGSHIWPSVSVTASSDTYLFIFHHRELLHNLRLRGRESRSGPVGPSLYGVSRWG